MTTTIVRDSIVGDNWIQQCASMNPIARKIGDDGQPTGDILTGPVRLAFCDSIFDKEERDSYGVSMLFTPYADFSIFYEEYYQHCGREFPQYYDAASGQYNGLHSPFKDQAEKTRFGGFTPGCVYMNSNSQYRPPVVDLRGNPVVDASKLYPGVWAICAVKPYAFGKSGKTKDGQPMKKGIGFGLQAIVLIGDDTRFGGGAPDTKSLFSDVNVTAPIARPDFANMPQGGAPAPAAGIPGYTAPGGGVPQPTGQPAAGFHMPQTTYTPPGGAPGVAGYAAAQPMAPTPAMPTTTSPSEDVYDPNDPMFQ